MWWKGYMCVSEPSDMVGRTDVCMSEPSDVMEGDMYLSETSDVV